MAPQCCSGLTSKGECLSLTFHCGPRRLRLVNLGGMEVRLGDLVLGLSLARPSLTSRGLSAGRRSLGPFVCYLMGIKMHLCSSVTAEGGRRRSGEGLPVVAALSTQHRGTCSFTSLPFFFSVS